MRISQSFKKWYLVHVVSERLCTAWDEVKTSLALGIPKISVARDEGIQKRKAWKRLNNSAQVEVGQESIR